MSKIRIYIEPQNIGDFLEINDKSLVNKLKNVLRLEKEDSLYIFDGMGREYLYRIDSLDKKTVTARREGLSASGPAPDKRIILGFPLVKEDKADFILQKATEMGVDSFVPFICERSLRVSIPEKRLKRWKKIMAEALRQSGRLWMPELSQAVAFEDILKSSCKVKLAASIIGSKLNTLLSGREKDILVIVGPEGGFSSSELNRLKDNGFGFLKLSPHILRVETAGIFSVGLINYFLKNR